MTLTQLDQAEINHLMELADRAYSQALADFYHPPLPSPKFEFDPSSSSYFYIDSNDWTVHLNLVGVPLHINSNAKFRFIRSITHHEIQHYLLCPYDGVTSGMMFASARKHIDDEHAMFVCNLFADLVVDSHLLKRFPSLTHERIGLSIHDSAARSTEHSRLWKLIVSCYRAMWGFPIPHLSHVDQETYLTAERVIETARKYMNNETKWPRATSEIAKILKDWLPETMEKGEELCTATDGTGERTIFVPLDVDAIMGSPIEDRNGDKARQCTRSEHIDDADSEMERLAIEVESRGGNLNDIEAVFLLAGFGNVHDKWIHFWYRAKARTAIRFEIRERVLTGSVPLAPEPWRLGDPIEELDLVQSLQAFPILVPNMSTRKWLKVSSYGDKPSKNIPDMLIVIDSSGSMSFSHQGGQMKGIYHLALISAFAALDFAERSGRRFAAINFSSGVRHCTWTRERMNVEKVLLSYQGSGTIAPIKEIRQLCNDAGSSVIVLMMTDAEIVNWSNLVKVVRDLVSRGHRFFLFHIGSSEKREPKTHRDLKAVGALVIPVPSENALVDLVVREVKDVYRI